LTFCLDAEQPQHAKSTPTFTSKNVRPDWLELRVPVCDNDVRFVPNSPLIVTATAQHQVYEKFVFYNKQIAAAHVRSANTAASGAHNCLWRKRIHID
jgi:hypothetical protein